MIHGYHIIWHESPPRDERRTTLIAAPTPATASEALRAMLGGAPIQIVDMLPTHRGMPRFIK